MKLLDSLIISLMISLVVYLFYKLFKLKYKILINIKYYALLYSFCYTLFPTLFLDYINNLQNWNLTDKTIFIAKIYSLIFNINLFIFCFFIKDLKVLKSNQFKSKKITLVISKIVVVISTIVLIILLLKFKNIEIDLYDRIASADLFFEIQNKFKLRTILFLNLCSSTILYIDKKKLRYYLPLFLVSIFEILTGGRTYIFIVIIFIYITLAFINKKLYLFRILSLISIILSYATIFRLEVQARVDGQNKYIEFILNSVGEFFSYITFPYIIQNKVKATSNYELIENLIFGIFPGFIKTYLKMISPGEILAKNIDRGYGLGLNLLTEAVYYSDEIVIILLPIIIGILLIFLNKFILKLQISGFLFILLFVCYLRLIFREGLVTYITTIIYIYITYFSLSLLDINRKFFISEEEDKLKSL